MHSLLLLASAAAAASGPMPTERDVPAVPAAEARSETEASPRKAIGENYINGHLKKLKIRKIRVDKKKTFPAIEIEWPYTFVETAKAGEASEYSTCLTVTYKGPSGRNSTPIGYRISIAGDEVVRFARIPEYISHPDLVPVPLFKKDVCQDLITRFGMALVPKPRLVAEAGDEADRKSADKAEPGPRGSSPASDASARPDPQVAAPQASGATAEAIGHAADGAAEAHTRSAPPGKDDPAAVRSAQSSTAPSVSTQQREKQSTAPNSKAAAKPVNASTRSTRSTSSAKAKAHPVQAPKTPMRRSDSIALSKLIGPGDISTEDVCSIGRLMLEQYFGSRSALSNHLTSNDPRSKGHSSGSKP